MNLERALQVAVVVLFLVGHSNAQTPNTKRPNSDGISVGIAVSNQHPLPFESIGVLVSLQNETNETKKVVASWRVALDIADVQGQWRLYVPHFEPVAKPPAPSAKIFAPGETKAMFSHLDYEEPKGQHIFARPGRYKVKAAASYDARFLSDEIEITVEEPQGIDAKAYEFLQKSDLPRYFSEHTVYKYPRTGRNVRALERFIATFDGSEYSYHARLGLALMWMQGVDNRLDLFRAKELLMQVTQKAKDPLTSRANYYLGTILQKRGDNVRAREAFQAVLKGNPDPYFRLLAEQELAAVK